MTDEAPPQRATRWSSGRYANLVIPNYIPPEALTLDDGQFVKAFLLRVQSLDITRLIESGQVEQFFTNVEITPQYNANGERINTPEKLLQEKRSKFIDDIMTLLKRHKEATEAVTVATREIMHKRYFTEEEMRNAAYAAILGARGSVHKELEKLTKCKIVLAGRGITNPLKDNMSNSSRDANEDPHIRVTAPTEKALQDAIERIEWMLSDDPEAQEYREKNRRRTAQIEGRYDASTWVSSIKPAQGAAGGAREGVSNKRGRDDGPPPNGEDTTSKKNNTKRSNANDDDGDDDDMDDDVLEFLNEL